MYELVLNVRGKTDRDGEEETACSSPELEGEDAPRPFDQKSDSLEIFCLSFPESGECTRLPAVRPCWSAAD